MKKLKIGIIGIGKMGSLHAKNIQKSDSCELIGFYDIDKVALNNAINTFPNTIIFDSLQELKISCDAVYICVPASEHFIYLCFCINNNINIFCEKPSVVGFINYKFIKSLIGFNDFKKVIHVGQVEKFNPLIEYLKKTLYHKDKFIAAAFYRLSQTNRNEDVSCIYDTMVHDIDLAYHLFPNLDLLLNVEIKDVKSAGNYIYCVNVKCTFKNGVINFLSNKKTAISERSISISADDYYTIDLKEKKIYKNNTSLISEDNYNDPSKDQLTKQLDCFVAACNDKIYWNGTTFNENSKVIELADLIEKEAKIYLKNNESKSLI